MLYEPWADLSSFRGLLTRPETLQLKRSADILVRSNARTLQGHRNFPRSLYALACCGANAFGMHVAWPTLSPSGKRCELRGPNPSPSLPFSFPRLPRLLS